MELWGADCLSPLSAFTSQCKPALQAEENMLTSVWWPHKFHWHCVGHLVSTRLYNETGISINVTLRNPSSVNVLEPSHFFKIMVCPVHCVFFRKHASCTFTSLQYRVNINVICTGKPKIMCGWLYCDTCFIVVVWKQTCNISPTQSWFYLVIFLIGLGCCTFFLSLLRS